MKSIRRKLRAIERRYRETKMFAKAMYSKYHPVQAQIVPTRKCNLSCTYCNEYDRVSEPVPVEAMLQRRPCSFSTVVGSIASAPFSTPVCAVLGVCAIGHWQSEGIQDAELSNPRLCLGCSVQILKIFETLSTPTLTM